MHSRNGTQVLLSCVPNRMELPQQKAEPATVVLSSWTLLPRSVVQPSVNVPSQGCGFSPYWRQAVFLSTLTSLHLYNNNHITVKDYKQTPYTFLAFIVCWFHYVVHNEENEPLINFPSFTRVTLSSSSLPTSLTKCLSRKKIKSKLTS